MIPGYSLSSIAVPSSFLYGDSLVVSATTDYEMGGVDLNDPSQGLNATLWRMDIVGDNLVLSKNGTDPINYINAPGTTEVSFAFDQLMNPFVTYVQNGQAKYYWYDTSISGYATTNLPSGALTPRASLDDKREISTLLGQSDIILSYILNNNLCVRVQRERYLTEHILGTNVNVVLVNTGMSTVNRFQFQITPL